MLDEHFFGGFALKIDVKEETAALLFRLKTLQYPIYADRRSGKTTALLIHSFDMMRKLKTEDFVYLVPNGPMVDDAKGLWQRMYPDFRSPLITTNSNLVRGARGFVIDELDLFDSYEQERITTLHEAGLVVPEIARLYGAIGSWGENPMSLAQPSFSRT